MPNIENHVRFCVRDFGKQNSELCYSVNSWVDAPSRELGRTHRVKRHDPLEAPVLACAAYGDGSYVEAEGVTSILYITARDATIGNVFCVEDIYKEKRGDSTEGNVIIVDSENSDTICMYRADGEFDATFFDPDAIYIGLDEGIKYIPPTPKNLIIAAMVLQHLALDGLITLDQIKDWNWEDCKKKLAKRMREFDRVTAPLKKGGWNELVTFEGDTGQTTESFFVPEKNWRVKWEYEPNSYIPGTGKPAASSAALPFEATLFSEKGRVYEFGARGQSFRPSGKGTENVYEGKKNFYLRVHEFGVRWKLIVEVLTPHTQVIEKNTESSLARANNGILITNSTFTEAAKKFAHNKQLESIGGEKLNGLLQSAHAITFFINNFAPAIGKMRDQVENVRGKRICLERKNLDVP